MIPDLKNWKPIEPTAVQDHLGGFQNWCLAAGHSIDWVIGRKTRDHGDTDIGVFRSELESCLREIGRSRVFLCNSPGGLEPWDGQAVPQKVHNIWITDPKVDHWMLQVMVYDQVDDLVVYRRDPRITWPKANHSFSFQGMNILNPFVNLLFKINKKNLLAKDCKDIMVLINEMAKRSLQGMLANAQS